ncbi:hypothetical protein WJX72_000189 [[Myrmecia] bisecta]|uniref:E2F/DP family winged-helix DNA-binding domain-containing protein n=1 Tax=[Myrmecia] bisecta TaxID=41462 RepID=A0AAW1Q9G8_9CHLO
MAGKDEAYSRKDKSLGLLCDNFLQLYGSGEQDTISLDEAAHRLKVERRRIYDIVNVLESVEVVVRQQKNRYKWQGMSSVPSALDRLRQGALQDDAFVQEAPSVGRVGDRKEKSLGRLSQMFIQMFLAADPPIVALDDAAKTLLGDSEDASKLKTKQAQQQAVSMLSMQFMAATAKAAGLSAFNPSWSRENTLTTPPQLAEPPALGSGALQPTPFSGSGSGSAAGSANGGSRADGYGSESRSKRALLPRADSLATAAAEHGPAAKRRQTVLGELASSHGYSGDHLSLQSEPGQRAGLSLSDLRSTAYCPADIAARIGHGSQPLGAYSGSSGLPADPQNGAAAVSQAGYGQDVFASSAPGIGNGHEQSMGETTMPNAPSLVQGSSSSDMATGGSPPPPMPPSGAEDAFAQLLGFAHLYRHFNTSLGLPIASAGYAYGLGDRSSSVPGMYAGLDATLGLPAALELTTAAGGAPHGFAAGPMACSTTGQVPQNAGSGGRDVMHT